MPVCTNCRRTTRYKSQNGNLCKDCSTSPKESNIENDLSNNEFAINKDNQLSELNVGDLLRIINGAITPINKKLKELSPI